MTWACLPAQWYVKWLPLLAVEAHGELLELGLPFLSGTVTLHPTGPMRYRVEGALFDGLTVFFEEKHLYIHMLGRTKLLQRRIASETEPPNLAVETNAGFVVFCAPNPPSPVRLGQCSTAKTPRNRGIFWRCA